MKVGMTKDRYLEMCYQLEEEPDPEKIPVELSDLPYYFPTAINIFNDLPDTYSGGSLSVYSGKSIEALEILFKLYLVAEEDRLNIYKVIKHLDSQARAEAAKSAKAVVDKANQKK